ncbi:unnamed protein product [Pleuronectes platessa]|uniref:Uncharacterized protein n=1 Tax=Pleuronectes platessa TaxID=8262 RepID=A0A9N7VV50_PLEPL|nr:unnamed protein product [Pleuronectes platessa]
MKMFRELWVIRSDAVADRAPTWGVCTDILLLEGIGWNSDDWQRGGAHGLLPLVVFNGRSALRPHTIGFAEEPGSCSSGHKLRQQLRWSLLPNVDVNNNGGCRTLSGRCVTGETPWRHSGVEVTMSHKSEL